MAKLTLEDFSALPRVNGLLLSPDGSRLVLQVQTLSPDGTRYRSALWGAPSDFSEPARRLTFSEKSEGDAAFLPGGDLVFASTRANVAVKEDSSAGRLFLLPRGGGEARALTALPGGLGGVAGARQTSTIVVSAPFFETSDGPEADEKKEKARKEAGVTALLHEGFPVRFWDHDLGPRHPRLLRLGLEPDPTGETSYRLAGGPEDLTPDAGGALLEASYDVSADGARVVTTWATDIEPAFAERQLMLLRGWAAAAPRVRRGLRRTRVLPRRDAHRRPASGAGNAGGAGPGDPVAPRSEHRGGPGPAAGLRSLAGGAGLVGGRARPSSSSPTTEGGHRSSGCRRPAASRAA